jgi:hypothetical protein
VTHVRLPGGRERREVRVCAGTHMEHCVVTVDGAGVLAHRTPCLRGVQLLLQRRRCPRVVLE